jgi:hypothetical protein
MTVTGMLCQCTQPASGVTRLVHVLSNELAQVVPHFNTSRPHTTDCDPPSQLTSGLKRTCSQQGQGPVDDAVVHKQPHIKACLGKVHGVGLCALCTPGAHT